MVVFTTAILKFNEQREKTGWTYIVIPADVAQLLNPGNKKSFRVKGNLDDYRIQQVAVLPVGGGEFIMPLNTVMRKAIGKKHGAMLHVSLAVDKKPLAIDTDLMDCLADEPQALRFFNELSNSHQHYFSKWVAGAKTDVTKAKRIAETVDGLLHRRNYPEMLRALKSKR